jgi:transposase
MRQELRKLSSGNPTAKWPALARFVDDGRICMTNYAAERAVRGIAVGQPLEFAGRK